MNYSVLQKDNITQLFPFCSKVLAESEELDTKYNILREKEKNLRQLMTEKEEARMQERNNTNERNSKIP